MDDERERGQRLVHLSREMVPELLKTRPAVETNVPKDARLESLWHSQHGWGYVLRLSSKEWDSLQEGEEIPVFDVEVTERDDDLRALVEEWRVMANRLTDELDAGEGTDEFKNGYRVATKKLADELSEVLDDD